MNLFWKEINIKSLIVSVIWSYPYSQKIMKSNFVILGKKVKLIVRCNEVKITLEYNILTRQFSIMMLWHVKLCITKWAFYKWSNHWNSNIIKFIIMAFSFKIKGIFTKTLVFSSHKFLVQFKLSIELSKDDVMFRLINRI